jgi:thioredoxin 1
MLIAVTDDTFEIDVKNSSLPVVVDFWAEWCGPCKQIAPALVEIAAEMEGKVTIAKVNIDENPTAPSQYGVRGIPTLILFKNGEVTATKVGALTKNKLLEWILSEI